MNDTPLQTGIHRELPTSQAYRPVERNGQVKKTRPPLSGLARLTLLALVAAAVGVLVGVIEGLVKSGHLFVPPLVVGTIYLVSAGLIATRIRWMPAVGNCSDRAGHSAADESLAERRGEVLVVSGWGHNIFSCQCRRIAQSLLT